MEVTREQVAALIAFLATMFFFHVTEAFSQGAVFPSIVTLYDGENCTGNEYVVDHPMPSLDEVGWMDRAISLRVVGAVAFHSQDHYGGKRMPCDSLASWYIRFDNACLTFPGDWQRDLNGIAFMGPNEQMRLCMDSLPRCGSDGVACYGGNYAAWARVTSCIRDLEPCLRVADRARCE